MTKEEAAVVQKFPFSPELRIAELERKNAVLERTVKKTTSTSRRAQKASPRSA